MIYISIYQKKSIFIFLLKPSLPFLKHNIRSFRTFWHWIGISKNTNLPFFRRQSKFNLYKIPVHRWKSLWSKLGLNFDGYFNQLNLFLFTVQLVNIFRIYELDLNQPNNKIKVLRKGQSAHLSSIRIKIIFVIQSGRHWRM